ncbi:TIGR04500 family putative peptide maturation system protein [Sphaerisporangium perillae]|uniref:TIGR04500 family putative peptide maturation system protein n=1 Tax=Sphaerisporangium perillae TaxID=2935860 RepID=UPI00200C1FD2|nr:TIGR04500 family putative peptide maturation system protein [Sphaerisporangium perillae]
MTDGQVPADAVPTMTDGQVLADAVRLLSGGTAERDLDAFRADHPQVRARLIRQREEYDGSLHHALLVKDQAGSTVSLSWCPGTALPWPLRGVHRAAEHLLLRVNGVDTPVARAIACLDFIWDESRVADRLVTDSLVREVLEEAPERFTDAELQEAMNAFRRARGLLTAEATRTWMDRNRITHAELEELVIAEASVARLRTRVAAGHVEEWFAEHGPELDIARVVQLTLTDADRLVPELTEPEPAQATPPGAFLGAAERAFAKGEALPGPLFVTLRRGELSPEAAERVFGAAPGTVVGPVETGDGPVLFKVLAIVPAVLDGPVRDQIERRLFAEWIERRRSTAKIEWFWGTTDRTGSSNRP